MRTHSSSQGMCEQIKFTPELGDMPPPVLDHPVCLTPAEQYCCAVTWIKLHCRAATIFMELNGFYHHAVALRTESEQLNQETQTHSNLHAFKSNYSSLKMFFFLLLSRTYSKRWLWCQSKEQKTPEWFTANTIHIVVGIKFFFPFFSPLYVLHLYLCLYWTHITLSLEIWLNNGAVVVLETTGSRSHW